VKEGRLGDNNIGPGSYDPDTAKVFYLDIHYFYCDYS
jgi:hypothetical protein